MRRGPRNARRERVRGVTGAGTGPEPLETGIVPHGPVHDSRCRLAARRALLSVKCQRNVTAGNPVQWISKPLNVQHNWENARPSQMVVPTVEIGRLVHVTVLRSARHGVKFTRNSQTPSRCARAPRGAAAAVTCWVRGAVSLPAGQTLRDRHNETWSGAQTHRLVMSSPSGRERGRDVVRVVYRSEGGGERRCLAVAKPREGGPTSAPAGMPISLPANSGYVPIESRSQMSETAVNAVKPLEHN